MLQTTLLQVQTTELCSLTCGNRAIEHLYLYCLWLSMLSLQEMSQSISSLVGFGRKEQFTARNTYIYILLLPLYRVITELWYSMLLSCWLQTCWPFSSADEPVNLFIYWKEKFTKGNTYIYISSLCIMSLQSCVMFYF